MAATSGYPRPPILSRPIISIYYTQCNMESRELILTDTSPCSREVDARIPVAGEVQRHRIEIRGNLLLLVVRSVEVVRKASTGGESARRRLCVLCHRRVTRDLVELRRANRQEVRAAGITRGVENIFFWPGTPRWCGISRERAYAVIPRADHNGDTLQAKLHEFVASTLEVGGRSIGLALSISSVRAVSLQSRSTDAGEKASHLHLRRIY